MAKATVARFTAENTEGFRFDQLIELFRQAAREKGGVMSETKTRPGQPPRAGTASTKRLFVKLTPAELERYKSKLAQINRSRPQTQGRAEVSPVTMSDVVRDFLERWAES